MVRIFFAIVGVSNSFHNFGVSVTLKAASIAVAVSASGKRV